MPIHLSERVQQGRRLPSAWLPLLLLLLTLLLAACQSQHQPADTAGVPPVGHYQGTLGAAGGPQLKAALDLRHPSAGHYDAELT
ncbi:hypothetical protein, partial [Hymenobacter agri]